MNHIAVVWTFVLFVLALQAELDALPFSDIKQITAVLDSCAYNSLLAVTVQERNKRSPQVFMFQCEETGVSHMSCQNFDLLMLWRKEEGVLVMLACVTLWEHYICLITSCFCCCHVRVWFKAGVFHQAELIKSDLDKAVQKGDDDVDPRRDQFDIRYNVTTLHKTKSH